ncbi:hypothetical protein BH10PSE13_BH10PSE13_03870 [soil metagenome]
MANPIPFDDWRFERSARRDFRMWAILLVGLVFAWAGSVVDPATNCDESGECAPWLVPVAKWTGIIFAMAGAGQLWANPSRGSRIDAATGDLVWWQRRIGTRGGDEGRIHPSRIARIEIVRQSDSADAVHLFDCNGERLAYFDEEVIPLQQERWTKRLTEAWPHILVNVRG